MKKFFLIGLASLFLTPLAKAKVPDIPPVLSEKPLDDKVSKETKRYGREKLNTMVNDKAVGEPYRAEVDLIPPKEERREGRKIDLKAVMKGILSVDRPSQEGKKFVLPRVVRQGNGEKVKNVAVKRLIKGSSLLHLKGDCYFPMSVEMTTLQMPARVECKFDNGWVGTVYGKLVADFKSYSLLFIPQEVEVESKRFVVVRGIATTIDESSVNIADSVNKRYLEKVLASATKEGVTKGLRAYEEYEKNKHTKTYTNGDTIIQERKMDSNYPLVAGLLGALSGMVNGITKIMESEFQNIPVLFKVNAGKPLRVRIKVKEEG